jgi:hypothetical protein
MAPLTGWAIHSVVALPLFFGLGLARGSVVGVMGVSLLLAAAAIYAGRRMVVDEPPLEFSQLLLLMAGVLAVALSAAIMAGVLPKISSSGVAVSNSIFDHSKVAMIDEMMRSGVPPQNPFVGDAGGVSRLAYYYLWHFSASEIALLTGATGWEADAALTFFTAFASLTAMMGLALYVSMRASSAVWIAVLATTATLRDLLAWVIGYTHLAVVAGWPSGFAGWLFQIVWAPQHVAAAGCAVLAIFFLVGLARRPQIFGAIVFGLLAAASFESSTWVGGVTFPLAVVAIAVMTLVKINPALRLQFLGCIAGGALLALLFASPLIYDQVRMASVRGVGSPIGMAPYPVFDDRPASAIGQILNAVSYWIVTLPIEWPVILLAGTVTFIAAYRGRIFEASRAPFLGAFGIMTLVAMLVGWLLVSRIAENNDLAWRGVLPGVVILIVVSAAGLSWMTARISKPFEIAFAILLACSLFEGCRLLGEGLFASPSRSAAAFAQSPRLWAAVRQYAGPEDRVANNPLMMRDMTAWPVNLSWALLSNRRSCYAGHDLALPFAPMPAARREEIDMLFNRVFAGDAQSDDLAQFARRFHCRVILLTPADGAWSNDPFASSGIYRLVENNPDKWRIYQFANTGSTQ